MKRSGPLRRITQLKRSGELRRTRTVRKSATPAGPDAETRRAVLERDQGCAGARLVPEVPCWGELHLHHKRRRSQGGDHSPGNLVTLCAACHSWVHAHPALAVERDLLRSGKILPGNT